MVLAIFDYVIDLFEMELFQDLIVIYIYYGIKCELIID